MSAKKTKSGTINLPEETTPPTIVETPTEEELLAAIPGITMAAPMKPKKRRVSKRPYIALVEEHFTKPSVPISVRHLPLNKLE